MVKQNLQAPNVAVPGCVEQHPGDEVLSRGHVHEVEHRLQQFLLAAVDGKLHHRHGVHHGIDPFAVHKPLEGGTVHADSLGHRQGVLKLSQEEVVGEVWEGPLLLLQVRQAMPHERVSIGVVLSQMALVPLQRLQHRHAAVQLPCENVGIRLHHLACHGVVLAIQRPSEGLLRADIGLDHVGRASAFTVAARLSPKLEVCSGDAILDKRLRPFRPAAGVQPSQNLMFAPLVERKDAKVALHHANHQSPGVTARAAPHAEVE
mmetsp:Transcript_18169/g.50882  ORF Transcript_18169/g.50882 Transcript_18169/m.50882 type:complete len:261 (-) Transcript_18169:3405-4187(-)